MPNSGYDYDHPTTTDLPVFDSPAILDDVLDEDLYGGLQNVVLDSKLTYGWKSHRENDPHGHWNANYAGTERHNLADIEYRLVEPALRNSWMAIKEHCCDLFCCEDVKLIRAYSNAHTFGIDGYFHTDCDREGEITVVIYLNDNWMLDWAGETVFADSFGEITKSVIPKRNRAVFFPSNLLHCARGLSRICMEIRHTMIFKARRVRGPVFEKLSSFLHMKGASQMSHRKTSLHNHLMSVYELLKNVHCPESTCMAGALHSVFGTQYYQARLLQQEQINLLREELELPQEAIDLIILFGVIDRSKVFDEIIIDRLQESDLSGDTILLLPKRGDADGATVKATVFQCEALLLIECANFEDQGTINPVRCPKLFAFWKDCKEKNTG